MNRVHHPSPSRIARAVGRSWPRGPGAGAAVVATALALVLCLLIPAGAAPANDTCAGATVIPGTGPFPYHTAPIDITTATITGDPPVPAFYADKLVRSVWFRFTPTANALYTISTCAANTSTTIKDTVMGLYTSPAGCAGPFVLVGDLADEDCNTQAELNSSLLADTTYFIVVWKYDDGSPEDGLNSLQLYVNGQLAPPNDRCENATPITLNVPAFGTTSGAERNYTNNAPEAFTGIGQTFSPGPGLDVVYSFEAPATGSYSIKLWNADVTQDLMLYAASSCPAGSAAGVTSVLAAANRSRVNSSEEIFCLPLTAGQAIRIFVDHANPADTGSSFILEVTPCETEQEPNDTAATASKLACGIEGSIGTSSDLDFFALGSFPPDWRAFVLVDGEASRNSDLDLRIVSTNATIEFDGNNNDTLFGDSSPNIAGVPLPGGPAYILVNYFGPGEAQPYRIYAVVQPPITNAQPESEPNDLPENANSGVANYYRGSLNGNVPSTDVDVYAFNVDTGDLIFVSLDSDPLRNNTPIDARLELVDAFGNVLITANDSAFNSNTNQSPGTISAFGPFSPAEGFVFRFTEEATFYVRVSISPTAVGSAGAGDYLLSISRNCRSGLGLGNTAPAILESTVTSPRPEGQAVNLHAAILESDLIDSLEATVLWGDGSSNVVALPTGGLLPIDLSHVYPPDLTSLTPAVNYAVSIIARDQSGAVATSNLVAVVQNVPPGNLVLTPGTNVIVQNQSLALNGLFSDPGSADAHIASIDWGDGTALQSLPLAPGLLQFATTHRYTVGGTNVTLRVTVTDDDAGSVSNSVALHIRLEPAAARFVNIIPGPGATIHLRLQGTPEATYRVEKADAFGAWSELGRRTVGTTGTFEIEDNAPAPGQRFYRAIVVE